MKRLDYADKPCGFTEGSRRCDRPSMGYMRFAGGHEAYLCDTHYWPLYRKYFAVPLTAQLVARFAAQQSPR